jgi:hypothetical protein
MPHIHHEGEIALPLEFVWEYLADLPRGIPEWLFGVTEFFPQGTPTRGLGACFTGTFQVKPVTLHSTVEVVAWDEGERITLRSVAGFQQETSLVLREAPGGCVITATVDYELPGGIAGKALGKALVPIFAACVRRTDAKLRERLLELRASQAC